MKHTLMMVVGCGLALLLIFLLPAMGLGSGWVLAVAFGATGLVFYLGCMLTMATVPHEAAVIFFNSLMHGLDVEPVLKTSVPPPRSRWEWSPSSAWAG